MFYQLRDVSPPFFSKMANKLTAEERNQVAFKYEKCNSVIEVQRWWRKTNGKYTHFHYRTMWNCHERLLNTSSSANQQKRPKTKKIQTTRKQWHNKRCSDVTPKKSLRQFWNGSVNWMFLSQRYLKLLKKN